MSLIRFQCPGCAKKLAAQESQAGRSCTCPGCGKKVPIPAPADEATEAEVEYEIEDEAHEPENEEDEEPRKRKPRRRTPTGAVARLAAIIDVILGVLSLLTMAATVILTIAKGGPGAVTQESFSGAYGALLIVGGIQILRGTPKDCLGHAFGSILGAFLILGAGFALRVRLGPIVFGINLFFGGLVLLTAGLYLAGRADYKAWRKL